MKTVLAVSLLVAQSVAFADSCYVAENPNHALIQAFDEDYGYQRAEVATKVTLKLTDEKKDGEDLRPAAAEINAVSASLRFNTTAIQTSSEGSVNHDPNQYGVECDGGTVHFFKEGEGLIAFTHHLTGSVIDNNGGCESLGAIGLSNISFAPVRCE